MCLMEWRNEVAAYSLEVTLTRCTAPRRIANFTTVKANRRKRYAPSSQCKEEMVYDGMRLEEKELKSTTMA